MRPAIPRASIAVIFLGICNHDSLTAPASQSEEKKAWRVQGRQ